MSSAKQNWNPELYEASHSFVWQFGKGMLELLDPKPGERVLDLGCGPGQLTYEIAQAGAAVVGLDASPDMIGQARQNYPALRFVLADAAAMQFTEEFDAIFSNAALHWILDASAVASAMVRALKPGGRLVAELGGKGNVAHIQAALAAVLPRYTGGEAPPIRTYFPGLAEYAAILEAAGFEVRMAQLFDRPTPLEGLPGMAHWLRQFSWYSFDSVPPSQRERALAEVLEQLKPSLFRDGKWSVDYRRLRLSAAKPH